MPDYYALFVGGAVKRLGSCLDDLKEAAGDFSCSGRTLAIRCPVKAGREPPVLVYDAADAAWIPGRHAEVVGPVTAGGHASV